MTGILYVLILGGLLLFVAGSVARAVRYARQPIHLRWELYPVPHEDPRRVEHGGSHFEEVDWWTKPRGRNLLGELRFMVPEMLFMKGLWEFNRALWVRSFPFHFGLYLLAGTGGLVVAAALLDLAAPGVMASGVGLGLHWIYTITGLSGVILGIAGAAALLHRRLTAEDLRPYTTPGDLFNLSAFIGTLGVLLAGFLSRSPHSVGVVTIVQLILTFHTGVRVPGLLGAGLILSALLLAYIPFTHMSHFIGKYFTYHAVRWNDEALRPGDRIERKMAEYLTYKPTWAAGHVGADGKRTWADVATTNPAEGGKP